MDKVWKILRWVGVGVVILLVGWLALTFKFNIGSIINWLLGKKRPTKKAVVNAKGEVIGKSVVIEIDSNPFRDKSVLKTHDGDEIDLPKGVKDSDVSRLVKIGDHDYEVELKHEKLTDRFNN